jgi:GTP-binding protein Era
MIQKTSFRSGFVALIGRPNVGKSTLLNALLKQKIAAVSPRPQTTRRRQLGILTLDEGHIIFMDTPGIHRPVHKLGEFMNQVALDTLEDADVIVWMVDVSVEPTEEDKIVATKLNSLKNPPPVMLTLNKADLLNPTALQERSQLYQALYPNATPIVLSATTGQGQDQLLREIFDDLPPGSPFYDEEQITDLYEREIAADLVREAALLHLRDEVPHSLAVRIDEYKERSEETAYVAATLLVERESHKGIVIGRGGEMLKKIGSTARQAIEEMSGRRIFLELRVKVAKNWRNDPAVLRQLGYVVEKDRQ